MQRRYLRRLGRRPVTTSSRSDLHPGRTALAWSLLAGILPILAPMVAGAAWLRPLEGAGNFHTIIDLYNRWSASGRLDVVLLISVANREVTFEAADGFSRGVLTVHVDLTGLDGTVVAGDKQVQLKARDRQEAGSPTLHQVFPVILRDVQVRSGKIYVRVEDTLRKQSGLLAVIGSRLARSEAVGDWYAPEQRRQPDALALGDPIFVARAPLQSWLERRPLGEDLAESMICEFLHPSRRYGLEQNRLQVYFEVAPPANGRGDLLAGGGLRIEVLAKDLDLALRDTIQFDRKRLVSLAAGGTTGVVYELDVNQLPAGAYQLGCAPANGQGQGWIAEFDVIWSLAALSRHSDELLGEGRTVFQGDKLAEFLAAGQAQREVMLEAFWVELDPDPRTPVNEAYLEFRDRVSYVRRHLGGFGPQGAPDPRGQIYLLLGPPEEVQVESIPLNSSDLEDAFVKVFDRYAPDREGTQAKGSDPHFQTQGKRTSSGDIPLTSSRQSRREVAAMRHGTGRNKGFELWEYDHAGDQLFPNQYSDRTLGLRFLFLDKTGSGFYVLESTNAFEIGN